MLVAGTLKSSDHFWIEGAAEWQPLFPYTQASPFQFAGGDDLPLFYVKDSQLVGPRTVLEVAAAIKCELIPEDTLIAFPTADRWYTWAELHGEATSEAADQISASSKWLQLAARGALLHLAGVSPLAIIADGIRHGLEEPTFP